jgi:serine/threonine-protein kinase
MGEVYAATDLRYGTPVAIKLVSRTHVDDVLMARLQREAEAARRIQSEFVPELFDVDQTDDGELFLAMERLHGESFSDRLRTRGPLPWEELRAIGDDILSGLIDAHAAGVIHRDLKPANIFLERLPNGGERARILDFGVCKLDTPNTAEPLTMTGEAVGTISYMAPEQIRGASKVDHRADLHTFAIVVFEALSGRLPHEGSGQIALLASKLERAARRVHEVARVPIPVELDALLARALARKPHDRFASADEMRAAWRALGPATVAPNPRPLGAEGSEEIAYASEPTASLDGAEVAPRRLARVGLAVAFAAVCASLVLIVATLRARPGESAAADPPLPATDIVGELSVSGADALLAGAGAAPSAPPGDGRSGGAGGAGAEHGAADSAQRAAPGAMRLAGRSSAPGAGAARGEAVRDAGVLGDRGRPSAPTRNVSSASKPRSGPHITLEPRY